MPCSLSFLILISTFCCSTIPYYYSTMKIRKITLTLHRHFYYIYYLMNHSLIRQFYTTHNDLCNTSEGFFWTHSYCYPCGFHKCFTLLKLSSVIPLDFRLAMLGIQMYWIKSMIFFYKFSRYFSIF